MRTSLLIALLLLGCSFCRAVNGDLLRTRELYYKASANKGDAEKFSVFLAAAPDVEKTLLSGYQGMSYMIRANYSWNPYNKLSFFTKGKDLLDEAIKKDPTNMELRFLRFCVQTNAPVFLGYSGMIEQDKTVILKSYSLSKDNDLKRRIRTYLMSSNHCTGSDKELLK
jgi:hypothetical protein